MLAFIDRHLEAAAVIVFFAAAQLCDVASTFFVYRNGGIHEGNPVTAAILTTFGPLAYLIAKMLLPVLAAGLIAFASWCARRYRRAWPLAAAYVGLSIASLLTVALVASNLYQLHQAHAF